MNGIIFADVTLLLQSLGMKQRELYSFALTKSRFRGDVINISSNYKENWTVAVAAMSSYPVLMIASTKHRKTKPQFPLANNGVQPATSISSDRLADTVKRCSTRLLVACSGPPSSHFEHICASAPLPPAALSTVCYRCTVLYFNRSHPTTICLTSALQKISNYCATAHAARAVARRVPPTEHETVTIGMCHTHGAERDNRHDLACCHLVESLRVLPTRASARRRHHCHLSSAQI